MKKGFSSFMTSIDSAITSRTTINDDVSDTFSIQSDISSDSENFAIVMGDDKTMDCIDVMFRYLMFYFLKKQFEKCLIYCRPSLLAD